MALKPGKPEWRRVPCNARNELMPRATGAVEKAVPCQNGCCTPTLLEGTAYGSPDQGPPPAAGRPLVAGLLEEFSHPGPVEASPGRAPPAGLAPLGHPALGPHPPGSHLVVWR